MLQAEIKCSMPWFPSFVKGLIWCRSGFTVSCSVHSLLPANTFCPSLWILPIVHSWIGDKLFTVLRLWLFYWLVYSATALFILGMKTKCKALMWVGLLMCKIPSASIKRNKSLKYPDRTRFTSVYSLSILWLCTLGPTRKLPRLSPLCSIMQRAMSIFSEPASPLTLLGNPNLSTASLKSAKAVEDLLLLQHLKYVMHLLHSKKRCVFKKNHTSCVDGILTQVV